MRENKSITRSFVREAGNAKKVFDSVRRTTETKADFPRQLAELQNELEKEKNSKYPNKERINRLELAVKVKLIQVERYCGTDR
jgi:hypothetical protein